MIKIYTMKCKRKTDIKKAIYVHDAKKGTSIEMLNIGNKLAAKSSSFESENRQGANTKIKNRSEAF